MSRFEADPYDWDEGDWALYHSATRRALMGKRGQKALRDLRDALLALPKPKLSYGVANVEDETVCTIGAGYIRRLTQCGFDTYEAAFGELLRTFPVLMEGPDDYDMNEITNDIRPDIADAMLAEIAFENDAGPKNETGEERYIRMLAWIERHILPVQGDAAVPAGGSGGTEPISAVESQRG